MRTLIGLIDARLRCRACAWFRVSLRIRWRCSPPSARWSCSASARSLLYRDISTAAQRRHHRRAARSESTTSPPDVDDGSISLSPSAVVAQVVGRGRRRAVAGRCRSGAQRRGARPSVTWRSDRRPRVSTASASTPACWRVRSPDRERSSVSSRPARRRCAQARQRLTVVLAVAGPVLAAAIGAAAWLLTGAALRPVRRMTNEAATISMAEDRTSLAATARRRRDRRARTHAQRDARPDRDHGRPRAGVHRRRRTRAPQPDRGAARRARAGGSRCRRP